MGSPEHKPKIDFAIGGQAVIEGVMMRSPSFVTVAVRKKDGSIKLKETEFISFTRRYTLLKLPIIRGIVNLFEMIVMGTSALNFSAQEFADDLEDEENPQAEVKEKDGKKSRLFEVASFAFSIAVSLALAIFLFKFIPLAITEWLRGIFPAIANNVILFNLIDGLLRIAIFFIYIGGLRLTKSFQRIFEYHGAEHKTVFAYEKGHELTPKIIQPESPRHPRCGTSFIMIVLIISILALSFVPRHPEFALNLLRRLSVIPLIAGISYEILKWTARHRGHFLVRVLTYPGILTQYITTKEPDDAQVEVAVKSLKAALELEEKKRT